MDKRLSIPEKILANPNMYTIKPPVQLNRLDLSVYFERETNEIKQKLYTRIMKSLVYFPGS